MAELEAAYNMLESVFIIARANSRAKAQANPIPGAHVLAHRVAGEGNVIRYEDLAEVCLILSGKCPEDMLLEHMFEEAASFRASEAGQMNAVHRNPKLIGEGGSRPHGGGSKENSLRDSGVHAKHNGHKHMNGHKGRHGAGDGDRAAVELQGSLHAVAQNGHTALKAPPRMPEQPSEYDTASSVSMSLGHVTAKDREDANSETETVSATIEVLSVRDLVAGSNTFRSFLFSIPTDELFCALIKTQLAQVKLGSVCVCVRGHSLCTVLRYVLQFKAFVCLGAHTHAARMPRQGSLVG
jgi:hypothetical protein